MGPGQNRFKQVDVGQAIVLNDAYLEEHNKDMKIESIVVKTMQNAEQRAREITAEALRKADEILENAKAQAAQIIEEESGTVLKQGYQEGFQTGFAEGMAQASQQTLDKLQAAEQILEKAIEGEKFIITRYQTHIVELMQYILKLILAHEIKTTPDQMAGLVLKATERLQQTGAAKVIINPESFQALRDLSPATMTVLTSLHHITFQTDPSCAPDEMYLDTVEGSFDISPETQAEMLVRAIGPHLSISPEVEHEDEASFLASLRPLSAPEATEAIEPPFGLELNLQETSAADDEPLSETSEEEPGSFDL